MSMRPSGIYNTNYVEDQALFRTPTDYFWLIFFTGLLFILPLLSGEAGLGLSILPVSTVGILTEGGILLISITGLNLLLGYTGQISLGQAAFMMIGAYTSAVLTRQTGFPFLLALPTAALVSGGIGLIFGLASLRVRGFYLAMATLAAQFMIPWAITNYEGEWVYERLEFLGPIAEALRDMRLGEETGLTVPAAEIFGITIDSNIEEYYLVLIVMLIMVVAARNMVRSRLGRAWIAIRDNELAAEQLGINLFRYKVTAFLISSIYAGVAGSLFAHIRRTVSPPSFNLTESIEQLAILVIGGAGFVLGPIFGIAFFLFVTRWLINFVTDILIDNGPSLFGIAEDKIANLETSLLAGLNPLLFGTFLALFLIFQPRGIAYRWIILKAAWRLRPFSKV